MVAPKRLTRQTESALCVQGHAGPSRLASARPELAGIVVSQFPSGTAVVSWAANVIVNSKKISYYIQHTLVYWWRAPRGRWDD